MAHPPPALARCRALAAVLCLAASVAPANLPAGELTDQWGYPDSLEARAGEPVMVVIVNVRRLGMLQRWQEELGARFPQLGWLRIGDLDEPGPVDLDRVRATLQRRVPGGASVLVDDGRLWATTHGLDTGQPNLLLFGPDGQLTGRWSGRWSDALGEEISRAITALLAPQ